MAISVLYAILASEAQAKEYKQRSKAKGRSRNRYFAGKRAKVRG